MFQVPKLILYLLNDKKLIISPATTKMKVQRELHHLITCLLLKILAMGEKNKNDALEIFPHGQRKNFERWFLPELRGKNPSSHHWCFGRCFVPPFTHMSNVQNSYDIPWSLVYRDPDFLASNKIPMQLGNVVSCKNTANSQGFWSPTHVTTINPAPLVQEVLAPLALVVPAQPDPKEPKGREDLQGRPWRVWKSLKIQNRNSLQKNGRPKKTDLQFLFFVGSWVFLSRMSSFLWGFHIFFTLGWMEPFGNQIQFQEYCWEIYFLDGHLWFASLF